MESRSRDILLTMLTPVLWATTYSVTRLWLPEGRPFFSGMIRALPVGLVILAFTRQLPRGEWWWKATVLGVLNIGLFFGLLFVGAYRLPGGLASTLQATGPLITIVLAALLLGERTTRVQVLGGVIGLLGVCLLVLRAGVVLDAIGLVAAMLSVLSSTLGYVLVKRWKPPVGLWTLTAWQLTIGGLVLVPVSLLVEGAPPQLDRPAILAYLWLAVAGTAIAYVIWFRGLHRLPAVTVTMLGLVNPVAATLLGALLVGEKVGLWQLLGMALVFAGVVLGARGAGVRGIGVRGAGAGPQPSRTEAPSR